MASFNLTGQGMQRNAADGLFTKPSILSLYFTGFYTHYSSIPTFHMVFSTIPSFQYSIIPMFQLGKSS